jgi:hypothetical protein
VRSSSSFCNSLSTADPYCDDRLCCMCRIYFSYWLAIVVEEFIYRPLFVVDGTVLADCSIFFQLVCLF